MEPSTESDTRVRLLGLGNGLMADDALGIVAARLARRVFRDRLEVVCSSAAGFHLLDHLTGAARLLVVDTILTGRAKPGTIHVCSEEQVRSAPGGSPHFVGLYEVLAVARELGLAAPRQVSILAVEASDCTTVGGAMHPDVRAAIPRVVERIGQFLKGGP